MILSKQEFSAFREKVALALLSNPDFLSDFFNRSPRSDDLLKDTRLLAVHTRTFADNFCTHWSLNDAIEHQKQQLAERRWKEKEDNVVFEEETEDTRPLDELDNLRAHH